MTRKQLLSATTIALFMAAAPLGLGGTAAAKGASHAHASSGHASAGGHHSGGGASKGGKSVAGGGHSGGGNSGNNGLDTARSIMNLVGGFLPH